MNKNSNQKNIDQESNNVDTESTPIKILIFITIIFIFWGLIAFIARKKTKTKLYKIYGTTDKTFQKWITYFCQDTMPIEVWKKKRLLTQKEFSAIQGCLGKPNPEKNYTKKDFVKIFEFQNYEYLKWAIIDSIDESKKSFITEKIYENLNKFPPKAKDEIANIINENKV